MRIPAIELGPWLPWGRVPDRAWLAAVVGGYTPSTWSTSSGECLACGGRGIAYTPGHERWQVFVCEANRAHAAIQLRGDL